MLEAEIEVWIAPSTFVQDLLPLGAIRWHNALSSQDTYIHTYLDSEDTNKDKVRTKPSGCKMYS